jgi:hypothetical protein
MTDVEDREGQEEKDHPDRAEKEPWDKTSRIRYGEWPSIEVLVRGVLMRRDLQDVEWKKKKEPKADEASKGRDAGEVEWQVGGNTATMLCVEEILWRVKISPESKEGAQEGRRTKSAS